MKKVEIFDPALCCSTGVCGPSVDPKLVQAAVDLEALKKQGVTVNRYNLAQDLDAFAGNEAVKALLAAKGTDVLPVTVFNGEVVKESEYPTADELAAWLDGDQRPASVRRPSFKAIAVKQVRNGDGGCCGGSGGSCCYAGA